MGPFVVLSGLVISVLVLDSRFTGSNLTKGDKNVQHALLWKGSKAVGLMSQDFRHIKEPFKILKGHFISQSVPLQVAPALVVND
jgi:hypothetical protein